MKELGIDLLATANNHSQDGGKLGITRTIRVLDSFKIAHTGTFADTTEFNREYGPRQRGFTYHGTPRPTLPPRYPVNDRNTTEDEDDDDLSDLLHAFSFFLSLFFPFLA
jgi:hypothetical protein